MRKIILYEPRKNAKRVKVFIPYECEEIRVQFKKMNTTFWHPNQKLWSIVNTPENLRKIKELFGENYTIKRMDVPVPIMNTPFDRRSQDALFSLEKTLVIKQYSPSSIKIYKRMLGIFLNHFKGRALKEITKDEIEGFIYHMIKKHKIGESFQNQLINAIKAYYEHVLGNPREYYDIKRPKKRINLPNVLSKEEVMKIIQSPKNIKHRAILWTIYSAGLRISELVNLRVCDIHSDEGFIFVKDSKGKKDRKTILSPLLVELLRKYYKKHRPGYWLFEGQTGGQYSVSSIRAIFRRAVKETHSNPWATVHTLRHSFATHCIENNVNMRYIQNMLGHNSPKTTELYTKTIQINNKNITSPLDSLLKDCTLQP